MNLFNHLYRKLVETLQALQQSGDIPADLPLHAVEISPPRETGHGEVATNAAMVLAKPAGMKPRDLAEKIAKKLRQWKEVTEVEIAGPGFINLTFQPSFWQKLLPEILSAGVEYGKSHVGKGEKVNVEYVSANPTGPMHVGHARGAVYGDALASLLEKAGFDVTREYYINDAGAQIDKLADSAFLRYRQVLGERIGDIPEGLYPGEYLMPVGEALAKKYQRAMLESTREQWLPIVRRFTVEAMMELIRQDLAVMGIRHDVFVSERVLTEQGRVEEALTLLEEKGLIYVGVLEPPKGKLPEDWESRPQTLFKSTQFGDDVDRAIKKSDGSWTYLAPDIAYHLDKCCRGFTKLVDVLGADHGGYVKRLKAAVHAVSGGEVSLEVKLCQLVKLMRNGVPAKMSKRAGTFETARDVVDEVGKDVLRFIMLTRKNDMPLEFDFEKVMEQSKDNPVFYVQYAHARAHSVMRMAKSEMPEALELAKNPTPELLSRLQTKAELELVRLMGQWPRLIEAAALAYEPHRVAFYLQELAASFHGLWNLGNEEITLRFLVKDDINVTAARLILARALATVIASGLTLLGVEPVEEMR